MQMNTCSRRTSNLHLMLLKPVIPFGKNIALLVAKQVSIMFIMQIRQVILFDVLVIYYPPRNVFALNTGKYRPRCIVFVYTGAPVLWIMSVNNFRFFNNIWESMQVTNMYNMSVERCYCRASADV